MNNAIIPAIIAIFIGISVLFYFSYDANDSGDVQTLPAENIRSVPEGYVLFVSEELRFSINYPESWKTQTDWPDDGRPPTIIISQDGKVSSENYDASFIIISAESFSD